MFSSYLLASISVSMPRLKTAKLTKDRDALLAFRLDRHRSRQYNASVTETADRFPHRGLARIGQRRDDGSTCVRLHRASLHDLHLHVLHIELFNSDLLLRPSHLRSVEVAQQEVPQWVQDEDRPPQQVPKPQTASALLATGFAAISTPRALRTR